MRALTLPPLAAALAMSLGGVSVGFAQTCPSTGFTRDAPNSRYAVQTDTSQVKDSKTTLVWQRCSIGQTWTTGTACTGTATTMNWQAALTAAAAAGSSSGFAWRVPNIKELNSLVETACNAPAINASMFPGTVPWRYFSSSSNGSAGWIVDFNSGGYVDLDNKTYSYYVRLVRSSQ